MPPHPYFGEPLATQKKVTLPSGTRLGFWKLCDEGDLELNVSAGGNRFRDAQIDYRLIIIIAVIRCDVLQVLRQVPLTYDFNALDVLRPVVFGLPLLVPGIASTHELGVAHKRRFGLKCVLV